MIKLNVVFKYMIVYALIEFPKNVSFLNSMRPFQIASATVFLHMQANNVKKMTKLIIKNKMKIYVDIFTKKFRMV